VGIERDKDWISLPRPREMMKEGDRLVVYGNLSVLKSVFK
jgi:K+/H+ antiporter YhaU regulatory subunit KhtT